MGMGKPSTDYGARDDAYRYGPHHLDWYCHWGECLVCSNVYVCRKWQSNIHMNVKPKVSHQNIVFQ